MEGSEQRERSMWGVRSTAQIPPPVIPISIPEPDVPKSLPKTTPIPESDVPKSLPKPNIPYPSRRDDQKSRDKASNQMEKIFQIFQDLRFDISFADALLLMPRFAPTIKSLLMNKEKLLELAKIPLNENCSAMLLKKLPEKLEEYPASFFLSCNCPEMIIGFHSRWIHSYDQPLEENDDLFDLECKTNDWKKILYDAPIDEAECYPGGDNDEIDAFLAIEISTCIEEGYYDSEGDVIFLENLLSDDTTHNLSPKVFFDHEPQQIRNEPENESLITFSPKSDPLHHEFAGELITLPPRIVREHEEYLNHMMLLCGNSSSQSPENFHVNPSLIIESLLTSPIHVEDSDPVQEEIDIFSGLDDSTPPGIESDVESEGDVIVRNNLLNDDISLPEYECFTFDIEPDAAVINNSDKLNEDECFDPGGGEIVVEEDNSFTCFIRTCLSYLTYPVDSPFIFSFKSEDTIFDPGISI
ncbi:hypothetical protein Tco_1164607 [Tanacetum coccineum]